MKTYTFDLQLASVTDSNLFLRKLWSEFRKEPSFSSTSMATKDVPNKFITLGLVNFGDNPSSGVSVEYKFRGCIEKLTFNMFPTDYETFLNQAIKTSLASFNGEQTNYEVSFQYESFAGQIQPYTCNEFYIYPFGENENLLSLKAWGFDFIDAATRSKPGVDRLFDLFSLFFKTSFSCTKVLSDHPYAIENDNSFRIEERVDDYYTEYKFSAAEFEVVNLFFQKIEDQRLNNLQGALRLYHNGISVQRNNGRTIMDTKKEIALSLYMSAIEVLAADKKGDPSPCPKCSQPMYKISAKVYDLAFRLTQSEDFAKMIKKEYNKRSKFLHAGSFFSENNFLGHYIPQLDRNTEHGSKLQYAYDGMFHSLHFMIYGVVFRKLKSLSA